MGGDMGIHVISDLKTIQLANGSGNTAITNSNKCRSM